MFRFPFNIKAATPLTFIPNRERNISHDWTNRFFLQAVIVWISWLRLVILTWQNMENWLTLGASLKRPLEELQFVWVFFTLPLCLHLSVAEVAACSQLRLRSLSTTCVNLIKSLTRIHPLSIMNLEPVYPALWASQHRVLSFHYKRHDLSVLRCRLQALGAWWCGQGINITQIL